MTSDNGEKGSTSRSEDVGIDLNSNISARLKNPLAGIPRDVLFRNVAQFAEEKGLSEHIPILEKGALRTFPFPRLRRHVDIFCRQLLRIPRIMNQSTFLTRKTAR